MRASTPRIGILGGGITGLTAAFYLLRSGFDVTVLESRSHPGGLATYFDFGPFCWDKFYHCILTSDRPLLTLVHDLGLDSEMRWTETKVGFFSGSQLYSMSSTLDFLKFPPLSLWEKFRLGCGVLYASRIRNGRQMESIPVRNWLIKIFGQGNYRKMWGPLLKCKLGTSREEASAAFIWATIFRLYSTRERNAGQKEKLGYVRGGYRAVLARLVSEIERLGGRVLTGVEVQRLREHDDGIDLDSNHGPLRFDHVISTVPSRTLASLAPQLDSVYKHKLQQVKYLGIVCVVLLLKRKLSPFYVTNLTDESLPFTGIVEMTNLISLEETRGRHLVYLPKYTSPGDPLFDAGDEEVWQLFLSNLKTVFPDLQPGDIEKHLVFREKFVQPIPVLNYSSLAPEMQTSIPRLLVANTTQIVNSTLNNNEMVKIARQAVEKIQAKHPSCSQMQENLSASKGEPLVENLA
ncbi:MAG TPA: NAD(P)/FAD-dependent oxidoreductase [Candidatus Angelobacter sp.]|jgi:protoporphyrinogen oxidase|nr:NAD(P)/FAD-dependent oxidoreductase [Candidatus Angelobacter sp.]